MSQAEQPAAIVEKKDDSPPTIALNRPSGFRPIVTAIAGAVITGLLLSLALTTLPPGAAVPMELQTVSLSQIDDALSTLTPATATAVAQDAKQCNTRLAILTVSAASNTAPQPIRIRSGNYLSPPIMATPVPQHIAIPYPAPYPTGRGVLSVEGAAHSVNVWLNPGWHATTLDGSAPISVWWTPQKGC